MATSSGSSVAVDLGEAAYLDDATSKLFFSDSSRGLSWPEPSEIESTLTSQGSLVALCSKHGVPSDLTPVCAKDLGWRACTPPPVGSNKLCVYAAALDAGLRFPLHVFYVRVLQHYCLAPSQLAPNAWTYLAAFVLRCEDAGVQPMVAAFRHFFAIYAHSHRGKPSGYHHFQPNPDNRSRLFSGTLRSRSGWKSRFFFLDCPSGWECRVKWGKPRREDARRVQATDTAIKMLEKEECVDIKVFMANRDLPVGDQEDLALPQLAAKAEAGAGAAAAVGAAAENASTTATRKRSRLSPAAVLPQPQPLPTSPPAALGAHSAAAAAGGPIRASSTGGHREHIPLPASSPPALAPIRASSTGGHRGHIPPPGMGPIRASITGGSSSGQGLTPPIRASSTGGRSGHFPPPPQQQGLGESTSAPHTMCASDALQLWEAITKAGEQAAMIAKLNRELQLVITWNTQWQKELRAAGAKHKAEIAEVMAHLRAANDRSNHLNEELVRLDKEYAAERDLLIGHLRTASVEVAQLKEHHATEIAQLNKEHAAEAKQLKEDLADDAQQLKNEGYYMGARDMRDLALGMYKGVISPDELKVEDLYSQQGAVVDQ